MYVRCYWCYSCCCISAFLPFFVVLPLSLFHFFSHSFCGLNRSLYDKNSWTVHFKFAKCLFFPLLQVGCRLLLVRSSFVFISNHFSLFFYHTYFLYNLCWICKAMLLFDLKKHKEVGCLFGKISPFFVWFLKKSCFFNFAVFSILYFTVLYFFTDY